MPRRYRPGVFYEAIYRCGRVGKNTMALTEKKSNEEPLFGVDVTQI